MSANQSLHVYYDRRDGTQSPKIDGADFNKGKLDFKFNASHVMFEVVGAGTCLVGFETAEVHAELDDTNSPPTNPRIYENIAVGKIFLKGTSADVKITAWSNGRR